MNPEWATRLYPCFSCLIDVEKMSFEELCYKYPKVAIEKMSDDYKTHCEKAPKMGKCLNFSVMLVLVSPGLGFFPVSKRIALWATPVGYCWLVGVLAFCNLSSAARSVL